MVPCSYVYVWYVCVSYHIARGQVSLDKSFADFTISNYLDWECFPAIVIFIYLKHGKIHWAKLSQIPPNQQENFCDILHLKQCHYTKLVYINDYSQRKNVYGTFVNCKNTKVICDLLCQNPPLTHTMSKNGFHCQWIASSIN